jgi:hypothetical protein
MTGGWSLCTSPLKFESVEESPEATWNISEKQIGGWLLVKI